MIKILNYFGFSGENRNAEKCYYKNEISIDDSSLITLGKNSKLINCKVNLSNSKINLADNVVISGYQIFITNGLLEVGKNSILTSTQIENKNNLFIDHGVVEIGNSSKIMAKEIVVRFGGKLSVRDFTAINDGTEIRCDESIKIGSYVMISYECILYDTNTHNIYPPEIRRNITRKEFPIIGSEKSKPRTKEVVIGDDCWLGKRAIILKGTKLGKSVIVGAGAVVSSIVEDLLICVGNPAMAVKPITFDNEEDQNNFSCELS